MTNRLFSHRLQARFLVDRVAALQENGSDVYLSFIDAASGGESALAAPLIKQVLPTNGDGKVMVHFAEDAFPPVPIPADDTVAIHFVAPWT